MTRRQPLYFAGYAAVFDARDRGGDVIRAGAFAATLAGRTTPIPLYWNHDQGRVIGRIHDIQEDARGLRVIAALDDHDGALSAAVRAGRLTGLSFGYHATQTRSIGPPPTRELLALDLVEISLVPSPMQPAARVHAVRDGTAPDPNPYQPPFPTHGDSA